VKTWLKVDHHTWFAARCCRPDGTAPHHHDEWQRGMFAHTSPIYVAVDGEWQLFDQDAAQYMLTLMRVGCRIFGSGRCIIHLARSRIITARTITSPISSDRSMKRKPRFNGGRYMDKSR
jgi:hypothetical protein